MGESSEVGDLWGEADGGIEQGMECVGVTGGFTANGTNLDDRIVEGAEACCFQVDDNDGLGKEREFWCWWRHVLRWCLCQFWIRYQGIACKAIGVGGIARWGLVSVCGCCGVVWMGWL